MQWNMSYEICAFVVLFVTLLLHLTNGYVPIKRSRLFLQIIVLEILAVALSVTGRLVLIYGGVGLQDVARMFTDIYYALQYGVMAFAMTYFVSWCGQSMRSDRVWYISFLLYHIVYVEEIIRNFLTHHLYHYDADYIIVEDTGINVLNGAAVYATLFIIGFCVTHAKFNSYIKISFVTFLAVVASAAVVVQNYFLDEYFVDFVLAIVVLVIYFIIQNPSEILDGNTNALNRNMIEELLRPALQSRKNFTLVLLALDDFKFVNKTFGIKVGDMMLMQVGNFLQSIAPKGLVYRYGSDQFALQIRNGQENVDEIISMIKARFDHPWITEEVSVMMSTTISCICCPDDGDTLETVIDVLDYSVLAAKKFGKGTVVWAKDLDLYALRKERAIEKAVEMAIENDTLEVYYQPIFSTEKDRYTSAEALVRIRDDLLGNISPEVFIPIAERNGSIVKMGTMIFEKVCRFIAEHDLQNSQIEYIEVNVSVVQCMQKDFVETLNGIMKRYGVLPSQINLEVTETAAANSLVTLQENIEKLHQQGISFSLDDYGSGYATIGYIHRLPFKIIKLDKLMVWDAFENERAGITLKHTVGMLKELKLHIVAEGVETQEQQSRLSTIGCDYLQGWYYSKAIPEQEFAELIKKAG